jgi:hypothetical protein
MKQNFSNLLLSVVPSVAGLEKFPFKRVRRFFCLNEAWPKPKLCTNSSTLHERNRNGKFYVIKEHHHRIIFLALMPAVTIFLPVLNTLPSIVSSISPPRENSSLKWKSPNACNRFFVTLAALCFLRDFEMQLIFYYALHKLNYLFQFRSGNGLASSLHLPHTSSMRIANPSHTQQRFMRCLQG